MLHTFMVTFRSFGLFHLLVSWMNGKVLAERAKFGISRTYRSLIQCKENSVWWLWKILINWEFFVLSGDFLELFVQIYVALNIFLFYLWLLIRQIDDQGIIVQFFPWIWMVFFCSHWVWICLYSLTFPMGLLLDFFK